MLWPLLRLMAVAPLLAPLLLIGRVTRETQGPLWSWACDRAKCLLNWADPEGVL
jgi:hypothetical protein